MAQGRPVESDVRARAIELIQAGMPRNAIAREVQIAPSSVSKIAADEGLSFESYPRVGGTFCEIAHRSSRNGEHLLTLYP